LRDDSHWNPQGIRIAAEAAAAMIRRERLIRKP
jgi:hypothetical protein